MFENITEVAILLIGGLFIGILISWFYWRVQISERKDSIEELETSIKRKNSDLKGLSNERVDLTKRLEERNTELENLNIRLSQREEKIRSLSTQVKDKDDNISALKEDIADMEKQNQNLIIQTEGAETQVVELEELINEKEQKVAVLEARISAMQDDFTILDGIGPKVSAVLRSAGIKSFIHLANKSLDEIRGILVAENPSLVRLTDPSTWTEQARLAADGNWDNLKALQDSIKETRRL